MKSSELYELALIKGKMIDFKLDTGSDCDVIPLKYVKQLKIKIKLQSRMGLYTIMMVPR